MREEERRIPSRAEIIVVNVMVAVPGDKKKGVFYFCYNWEKNVTDNRRSRRTERREKNRKKEKRREREAKRQSIGCFIFRGGDGVALRVGLWSHRRAR